MPSLENWCVTFLLSTDDDERMQQKARLEDDLSVASERLETLVRGLPPSLSPSLLLCLHSSLPLSPPLLLHLHSSLPLSVYPPIYFTFTPLFSVSSRPPSLLLFLLVRLNFTCIHAKHDDMFRLSHRAQRQAPQHTRYIWKDWLSCQG